MCVYFTCLKPELIDLFSYNSLLTLMLHQRLPKVQDNILLGNVFNYTFPYAFNSFVGNCFQFQLFHYLIFWNL